MPAQQIVADGGTASWPHDDPSRPGWTFDGWFQGDVPYDFSRPVTKDTNLKARWGQWATNPTSGPWQGGTDVTVNSPKDPVRLAQVSAAQYHSLALGSDGNAYAWGRNDCGQLGDGTTTASRTTPVPVSMPAGVKFTQVSAGGWYSMALDRDGRIWTWGFNDGGRLGRGSVNSSYSTPGLADIPSGTTFKAISAGNLHSLALDTKGNIWTWGVNYNGQLGRPPYGSKASDNTPAKVTAPEGTLFTAISAGVYHSMALTADGTAWTWGDNGGTRDDFYGVLGRTPTDAAPANRPGQVDTDRKFTAISAGYNHSMAIGADNTVLTWGGNSSKQLGRSGDTTRPGQVPGMTGATDINAGWNYSTAITDTGAWAWGSNDYGQLGTNTDTTIPARMTTPDETPAPFTYTSLNTGNTSLHMLVIGSDGNTYSMGRNDYGQLGTNTTNSATSGSAAANPKPGMVWRSTDRRIASVLFGDSHNVGGITKRADGWHVTSPRHHLGTVTLTIQSADATGASQPDDTSQRFTYTGTAAAVTFKSEHGDPIPNQQVAVGDTIQRPDDPSEAGWTFDGWFQGNVAYDFSRPIKGPTTLTARWTFGNNQWSIHPTSGPRTGGNDVRIDPPNRIAFSQVSSGQFHSLALGSDGNAYAWGRNDCGQLGTGGMEGASARRTTPVMVKVPDGVKFTHVSNGGWYSMALDRDGRIWTWGNNEAGRLGRGSVGVGNCYPTPGLASTPPNVQFIAISAGNIHSMALDRDGNVWTWGQNKDGQLGRPPYDGSMNDITPTKVAMPEGTTFTAISAGDRDSMALAADGTAWTWGRYEKTNTLSDYYGILGRDSSDAYPADKPGPVATDLKFTAISAGAYVSMGIATDGNIYTWGGNKHNELGRSGERTRPGRVPGLTGAIDINASWDFSTAITDTGAWAWGSNQYGQLGTTSTNGSDSGVATPTRIPKPDGATSGLTYFSLTIGSNHWHMLIIGSDGNVYSFGRNDWGQLGINSVNTSNGAAAANPRPAGVWFPWPLTVSSVTFDGKPSMIVPVRNPDGSWKVRPPAHAPGPVDVKVSWSRRNLDSGTAALTYTYLTVSHRVRFDPANGDPVTSHNVDDWGQAVRPAADPGRAGYRFDGWFQGNVAFDFTQPVTSDTTITARWSRPGPWTRSPASGRTSGGTSLTLTPPDYATNTRLAGISADGTHSLAVSSDGRLYAWGDNDHGQLGNPDRARRSAPTSVPTPDDTRFTQATAGDKYSAALDTQGRIWTWGDNDHGQLGHGTTSGDDPTPRQADTGDTRFTQISAGDGHMTALDTQGRAWTWGDNTQGQLGDGNTGGSTGTPTMRAMPPATPSWLVYTQIQAGGRHTLAIANNGRMYAWGDNNHGQLGDGNTGGSAGTPTQVQAPTGTSPAFTWLHVTAGTDHTFAIGSDADTGDDIPYTFGSDQQGQLGAGSGTETGRPVKPGLPATITAISAGGHASFAIDSHGTLHAWGDNTQGQLGDNTTTSRAKPVAIDAPASDATWVRTAGGTGHTLAIDSHGTLHAWGDNTQGQLGDNTTTSRAKPVAIDYPDLQVASIDFGGMPGADPSRQPDGAWTVIAPPRRHRPGTIPLVIHWNQNGLPQPDAVLDFTYTPERYTITYDSDGGSPTPPSQTADEDTTVTRPANPAKPGQQFDGWFDGNAAYDFTQPIQQGHNLKARWSPANAKWTLTPTRGIDTGGETVTLTPPPAGNMRLSQVSAGSGYSLAIGSNGKAYSWGDNSSGQLGDGTRTNRNQPIAVAAPKGARPGFTWLQAAAGTTMSIGLGSDGMAYAWGTNATGLGDGTTSTSTIPVKVVLPADAAPGFRFTQVAVGRRHILALGSDGNIYAWGSITGGLGDGKTGSSPIPIRVAKPGEAASGFSYIQISAGSEHSLAIGTDRKVYAWGSNANGRLGLGDGSSESKVPKPLAVPSGMSESPVYIRISAGSSHSVALDQDGRAWAWGSNSNGQVRPVGDDEPIPVQVALPRGASDSFAYQQVAAGDNHSLAIGTDQMVYGWGDDTHGQLGDGRSPEQPAKARDPKDKSQGLKAGSISAGDNHSLAIGTDGTAYGFGRNSTGQNGTGSDNTDLVLATRIAIPPMGIPTRLSFGDADGTIVSGQPDGTWQAITPSHRFGQVSTTIEWTLAGEPQTPDTSNIYIFMHSWILPNAGGRGIILLLLIGLMALAAIAAQRKHRMQEGMS